MLKIFENSLRKGIQSRRIAMPGALDTEIAEVGEKLKAVIKERFKRSFHIREVDTGSCGACEAEIIACTNPLYDIQRFGVDFVASPRHADALLVTGPVSVNMEHALRMTYEAMPAPKLVIALGRCAIDGGRFKDSYYTRGGVHAVLPVIVRIPGFPPPPIEIIKALLSFLSSEK